MRRNRKYKDSYFLQTAAKNKHGVELNLVNSPPSPDIVPEKPGRQKSSGMDTINDHPSLILPHRIHTIFCCDKEYADLVVTVEHVSGDKARKILHSNGL
jgi:hypothetical protein